VYCGEKFCPVLVLVQRFLYLRDNGADPNDIKSSFLDHLGRSQVIDDDMMVATQRAVIKLCLQKN